MIGVPRKINGDWIYFPPRVSRYFPKSYDLEKWRFIEAHCKGASLDLGAHIGLFTIKMSKLSESVVAVEPTIDSYSYLKKVIQLNKARNVVVLNSCVSDSEGFVDFYQTKDIASCLNSTSIVAGSTLAKKKSFTIDSLNIPFKFIKIDIEGGELKALKGALKTLEFTQAISLEIHPAQMRNLKSSTKEIHKVLSSFSPKYFANGRSINTMEFEGCSEIVEIQILLGS